VQLSFTFIVGVAMPRLYCERSRGPCPSPRRPGNSAPSRGPTRRTWIRTSSTPSCQGFPSRSRPLPPA